MTIDLTKLSRDELIDLEINLHAERHQRDEAAKPAWPVKTKIYLHRDKDSNWDQARELKLSDEASRTFAYTAMEVAVDAEVHEDGTSYATAFGGARLATKVQLG